MAKSTIFFACLAIVFAGTTVAVSWRLIAGKGTPAPQVEGVNIALGLPTGQAGLLSEGGGETEGLFRAGSALVWNTETDAIQFEQNGFERRPIASITKLVTAMVALDHGIPWEEAATIELEEYVQGGRLLLHPGETVSVRDLFHASLVASANNATLAYVRALKISEEEFVREMNRKAVSLGLEQTEFTDVTGLDVGNISTAYEVARLAEAAFTYPEIAAASSL
ncbi:MAG: serine hydrolase, partial [Patescibacteria group bacterium]